MIVFGKVIRGLPDGGRPGRAAGDPVEGVADTFQGLVAMKPVLLAHAGNNSSKFRAQPLRVPFDRRVGTFDELFEWFPGVEGPVSGKKMIEEDIYHDSSKATSLRSEQLTSSPKLLMGVRKAVDFTVHYNPGENVRRVAVRERSGSSLDEITEEIADAGGLGWSGQVEMSEIVQGLR